MRTLLGLFLALAAAGGTTPGSASSQADPPVAVRTVRFYRADAGQTRVKAFVQIPYSLMALAQTGSAGGGRLSYEVSVRITDTSGLTLHADSWRNHAAGGLRQTEATAMEILDFQVAPGRYQLAVTVTDSVTGQRYTGTADVVGFAERPDASDLLLSPAIRTATNADTMPRPGELGFGASGEILVTAATRLELTPLRAVAHYLIEVYSEEPASGTLTVAIRDRAGKVLLRTAPAAVQLPAGGQVLTGHVDLTGLPPGDYELVVEPTVAGATVERAAPLRMADLESTLRKDQARRQADRVTDEGYFATMTLEELDEAQAPLGYIAVPADQVGAYDDLLSADARRRWLTEFWRRRDPDPATPRNEAREFFYGAIAYADEHYRERGRAGREGWRTDRGRVYARFGTPTEVLSRVSPGRAPPYEVWQYSKQKNVWFIFADRTRLEQYALLCSNDVKETCRNDWREVLGEDAVQDIGRFIGVDFYARQGSGINF